MHRNKFNKNMEAIYATNYKTLLTEQSKEMENNMFTEEKIGYF